jgi:nicotinamide mononucleotide transporter
MSELIYSNEFLFQILEVIAMTSALVYIFLAIKENNICWWFGWISSSIYVIVFVHAKLYQDALLNIFYAVMAVYGWWSWKKQPENNTDLKISWLTNKSRISLFIFTLVVTGIMSYLFHQFTDAAFPLLTSATSAAAMIATYLQARKKMENWILFFLVNVISIYVYYEQELFVTVFLYAMYAILSIKGWMEWRKKTTS